MYLGVWNASWSWARFGRGWLLFFMRMAPIFAFQMPLYEQTRRVLGLSYMS
jgi:hypothetical protein